MGYRANIRTKSIVEYKAPAYFNYKKEELAQYLTQVCPNAYIDGEYGMADHWEIPIDELQEEINRLKCIEDKSCEIIKDYTIEELIEIFQSWIDIVKNNPDNFSHKEWIDIDWF